MEEPADKERFPGSRFLHCPPGFTFLVLFFPLVTSAKSILAVRRRGKRASVVSEFTQSDVPFLHKGRGPSRSPSNVFFHTLPPPPAISFLLSPRVANPAFSPEHSSCILESFTHPVKLSLICSPSHSLAGMRAFQSAEGPQFDVPTPWHPARGSQKSNEISAVSQHNLITTTQMHCLDAEFH